MRTCGNCTACCEGWLHDESLEMEAGKPCQHCTSRGCAIYDNRPEEPCRTFRCEWLKNEESFDDEMRPDRCGAILISDRPFKQWDVIRVIPVGVSVPKPTLSTVMKHAAESEKPLIWTERRPDYADHPMDVSVGSAGPEEFTIQMKWDMRPEDVWSYSKPADS